MFSDTDLCQFLDLGYAVIQPQHFSRRFHNQLYREAERLYECQEVERDPHKRVELISDRTLDGIRQLNALLGCDELTEALNAILGDRHFRYPHSFIHRSGDFDQGFHKDSPLPWGSKGGMRSHRPNWAMVFYYPQETTVNMGPTEILPGSQYWNVDREGDGRPEGEDRLDPGFEGRARQGLTEQQIQHELDCHVKSLDPGLEPLKLVVPQGSLVLVHFDLFHRGTRHTAGLDRYMYKFWYVRTTEPRREFPKNAVRYECKDNRRTPIVEANAQWMGVKLEDGESSEHRHASVNMDFEADRLAAMYRSVFDSPTEVQTQYQSSKESHRRAATYALANSDQVSDSVYRQIVDEDSRPNFAGTSFLLGEIGTDNEDLGKLQAQLVAAQDINVKLTAINALGRLVRRLIAENVSVQVQSAIDTLIDVIKHAAEWPSRGKLVASVERQCAYIALLNIVASTLVSEQCPPWVKSLASCVETQIQSETDRYAKGTAEEVLRTLGEFEVKNKV